MTAEELDLEPPKDDPIFVHHWNLFVGEVSARENFKRGHLAQLEVLCDLYAEKVQLEEEIKVVGRSYVSEGRNGHQIKLRPEVGQLNRVRAEIRNYSRMLGLLLFKDTEVTGGAMGSEEDDFM